MHIMYEIKQNNKKKRKEKIKNIKINYITLKLNNN